MGPMSKTKVLVGLIGIIFLVWGIGILSRVWANPIFAPFWVISNGMADALSYVGIGIGALFLALAVIFYYQNNSRSIDKIFAAGSSQTFRLKLAMPELYDAEADNVEYHPFVIINGARTNLGSEEMEKIVE